MLTKADEGGRGGPGTPEFGWRNMWTAPYSLKKKKGNARTLRICACLYSLIIAATENIVWFGLVMWTNRRACWCYKRSHWPMTGIRWNMYSHLVFYYIFPPEGLAAQSKAEAIGWNKISSANQRPGFQMIFYTCQSARHMIMQLWFAV